MRAHKSVLYFFRTFHRKVDNSWKISNNRGGDDKKINWDVFLDSSNQSWTSVNFIFHAGFLRALWVQRSRHTLRFWRTRRTSPSRRLARKREFHLLRFDQQITHETFAEISERVTHTLNNFPIGERDKTIKVNEQALAINNNIKWREDEILTKLVFLLSKFESLLLTL